MEAAAPPPPAPATAGAQPRKQTKPKVEQDPRAHPKDHIIRRRGRSLAGDVVFCGFNLGLWGALVGIFRRSLFGAGAVLGVRAVVAMDLVRALRHCFWKLTIGEYVFQPSVAALVALFNFGGSCFYAALARRAAAGGGGGAARGALAIGIGLFALGSFTETFSELQRRAFKRRQPAGTLYTGGLFSLARSINYTGYITWRLGMATATGHPAALVLPAFHSYDFGARAVPMLERYMSSKYGAQWSQYTQQTPSKLVPGVW